MRYVRLELKNYCPLLWNSVTRFVYEPHSQEQIIIGDNGSGKSSVLRELSLLPSVSADYTKGGYSKKTVEDKGSVYELISEFNGGPGKHTFIKDGEVLNDKGTAQIQTTLVKQHFNYDSDIHALMVDAVRFTEMGPQQRRDWVTRISGADFSYAIGVWNKLRGELRDATGALKHVNSRLTELSEEGEDIETKVNKLEEKIKVVGEDISVLLQAKPKNAKKVGDVIKAMSDLREEVDKHKRFAKEKVLAQVGAYKQRFGSATQGVLEVQIDEEEESLRRVQATLDARQKDYERISDVVEKIEAEGANGVGDIEARIQDLNKEEKTLLSRIGAWEIKDEPRRAHQQTLDISQSFESWLAQMPANKDKEYGQSALTALMQADEKDQENLRKWDMSLQNIEERISHIKEAREEQCPKCSYRYIPGVSEGELESLSQRAEKGRKLIRDTKEKRDDRRDQIEAQREYLDKLRWLKNVIVETPRLKPLWDFLLEDNQLFNHPSLFLINFNQWKDDLKTSIQLEKIRRKRDDLQSALEKLKELPGGQDQYGGFAHTLQDGISKDIETIEKGKERLRSLKEGKAFRERIDTEINRACEFEQTTQALAEELKEALRSEDMDKALSELYGLTALLQDDIQNARSKSKVLAELNDSKVSLEEEVETLSVLVEHLSPKEGLIAEMITDFIEEMTNQMNEIIAPIWTYDLRVLPCSREKGDLDYRFPLAVRNNEDRSVKDIAMASTGQKDVINFAFKLTALQYMGLGDFPLCLDELAPHMSEQHRINISQYVSKLVTANRCSQLFMISHYQAGHGSFNNAEYCVMDPNNITLPHRYNEHVTLQ